jgi:sigma-B regulation protein RsbU (phosphoserine phosphatase)
MPNILIADDQYEILHALRLLLKREGYQTVMAGSPEAVIEEARRAPFDLMLVDLNFSRDTTSGREGLDLLSHLRTMAHAPPVIVMTAWSTVPLAVEAMRLGAVDFIEKPWDNARLLDLIRKHIQATHSPAPGLSAAADLEIARAVQHRLLPQQLPHIDSLDYAVKYQPAGQVGGDYYDFLPALDGSTVFVVADVSGKGISAAILMATIQSFFRSRRPEEFGDLVTLLTSLNRLFLESSPVEQYATLFLMRYSDRTRKVDWVNCGQTSPLLVKSDGGLEQWDSSATVLGMFPGWSGRERQGNLGAGDTLLVFSDGLTEAADPNGEEFGMDRLTSSRASWPHRTPAQLVESIAGDIRQHADGRLADDLTLLALRGRAVNEQRRERWQRLSPPDPMSSAIGSGM